MKKLVTAALFVAFILGITIFLLTGNEEDQTHSTPVTVEEIPVGSDSQESEEKTSLSEVDLSGLSETMLNVELIRLKQIG